MSDDDDRWSAANYNTERFRISNYDFLTFPGPRAGEPAADFTLHDLDGNPVTLADFRGKWLVIETGSMTCSMYSRNVERMNALVREFPDVEFVLVYVREAHPGERLPRHRSFEEKMQAAQRVPDAFGEARRVLVDSLDGDMHRAYTNNMPNVVYVINPEGVVTYRCDWMIVDEVRDALQNRDRINTREHADMEDLKDRPLLHSLKTMFNGGWLALWDFVREIPKMKKSHVVVDDYYREKGALKR